MTLTDRPIIGDNVTNFDVRTLCTHRELDLTTSKVVLFIYVIEIFRQFASAINDKHFETAHNEHIKIEWLNKFEVQ